MADSHVFPLRGTLASSGRTGYGTFRVGTQRACEVGLLYKSPHTHFDESGRRTCYGFPLCWGVVNVQLALQREDGEQGAMWGLADPVLCTAATLSTTQCPFNLTVTESLWKVGQWEIIQASLLSPADLSQIESFYSQAESWKTFPQRPLSILCCEDTGSCASIVDLLWLNGFFFSRNHTSSIVMDCFSSVDHLVIRETGPIPLWIKSNRTLLFSPLGIHHTPA